MSDDRPILVSQAEIEKRRQIGAWIRGSHAVDNLHANPDTLHIFRDYEEGRIATTEEVNQLLHEHYSKIAKSSE
ncbi:antitoxin VbhA family protein [Psychrobacter sp. B38]|uniref:antitoxin VbhA family protein n=1 Tax=Psychrobacter sp. B38 TaxID=3143538 RepID=UPI003210B239